MTGAAAELGALKCPVEPLTSSDAGKAVQNTHEGDIAAAEAVHRESMAHLVPHVMGAAYSLSYMLAIIFAGPV